MQAFHYASNNPHMVLRENLVHFAANVSGITATGTGCVSNYSWNCNLINDPVNDLPRTIYSKNNEVLNNFHILIIKIRCH